jgi:formylglycine-generating enzyme required for sulfatase activity
MAYAHSKRIIHRDLKPSNILVGEFGETVVVDWGIASDLREENRGSSDVSTLYQVAAAPLTVAGSVMGTAQYMPSEQAVGRDVEEPADVYAIGAILYHLLTGTPPYQGNTSAEVLQKVSSIPPEPLERRQPDVPNELATIVRKAMARDASDRYETAAELTADLKRFQTGQLVAAHQYSAWTLCRRWAKRHRAIVVSALAILLAVPATYYSLQLRARRNLNAQVQALALEGSALLAQAREQNRGLTNLRNDAFFLFDHKQTEKGEELWEKVGILGHEVDVLYSSAGRSLEAALSLKNGERSIKTLVADVLYERVELAETENKTDKKNEILERLFVFDDGTHRARWEAPGRFDIESVPTRARVLIQRYRNVEKENPLLETIYDNLTTPIRKLELPQGSYLMIFAAPGRLNVRFPVLVRRGDVRRVSVHLPSAGSVPDGFIFVPQGTFLFGSSQDHSVRKDWLYTVPLHEVTTDAYLIAAKETTFGDWLEYLNALKPAEAVRRAAEVSGFTKRQMSLSRIGKEWQLVFGYNIRASLMQPRDAFYIPERKMRQRQNWHRLPMVGVSIKEIEEYLSWLQNRSTLIQPRLCSEFEWERAARGADAREYPHGYTVSPSDANFFDTYERNAATVGPDETGAFPFSRSPFGVDDMCGNAAEFTRSSLEDGKYILRGGSYAGTSNDIRSNNRQPVDDKYRAVTTGFRLCADLE